MAAEVNDGTVKKADKIVNNLKSQFPHAQIKQKIAKDGKTYVKMMLPADSTKYMYVFKKNGKLDHFIVLTKISDFYESSVFNTNSHIPFRKCTVVDGHSVMVKSSPEVKHYRRDFVDIKEF